MKEFYLKRGENTYGPLSSNQLRAAARSGRVAADDRISRSRNGPWQLASEIGGLFPEGPVGSSPSKNVEASSDSGVVETETYAVVETATSDVPDQKDEYSWGDEEDYETDFTSDADDSPFLDRTAALGGEFFEELIPRSRIPREVRELLCSNEKVLFADNPSKTVLYLRLILCNLLDLPLTIWGLLQIVSGETLLDRLGGVFALLSVALVNYWICISWKQTFYVITTSRLMARAGFFNRRIKVAPIRNVQEISVNTGLIDRWLHLNTVHFATAANSFLRITGGVGVTFKSVQSRTVMRAFQHAS